MASLGKNFTSAFLFVTLVIVVVSAILFGVVAYSELDKLTPFKYEETLITANPYAICPGDDIKYDVTLAINELGHQVTLHTSFYDINERRTLSLANSNVDEAVGGQNTILIGHPLQVTEEPLVLSLRYASLPWLTPGNYALIRVATVGSKNPQYYAVEFAVMECLGDR